MCTNYKIIIRIPYLMKWSNAVYNKIVVADFV